MQPVDILEVIVRARGVIEANRMIAETETRFGAAERAAIDATDKVERFGRESAVAHVDLDTVEATRKAEALRREVESLSDKTVTIHTRTTGGDGGAADSFKRTADSANILQRTLALVKPAALITGLGFAAQAASAAAAGVVGLVSALAPLSGALAAYPSLLSAFAQGMGVAKFAMTGLSGATDGITKALEKPTPAMNHFTKLLDDFAPRIVHLRNIAQGPILRGLSEGLRSARPAFDQLNPAVRMTGIALGDLAKDAGNLVGSSAFAQDIRTVGTRNAKIIDILGHAALRVGNALRHVVVAAGPLTMWLARLAGGWAKNIQAAALAGRETGKMRDFFESTRAVIERLLSIAGNLGTAFWNIAKGGKQLGDELLRSLDKTTESFAKWTKSAEGQNKIKAFFDQAKGPIYEVAKLIRDVTKGFLAMGQQPGLTNLIRQFRTELLPILLRVVNSTTTAFGPHLIAMITAFARAFEPLAGSSGPLVLYVDILTSLAKAAAWVTDNVPGAGTAITFLVGSLAVMKAANFAGSILGVQRAMALLRSETVATTAATVLSKAVMIATRTATLAWAAAQWLLNAALAANPIGLVIAALVALGAALVVAWTQSETFREIVAAAWDAIKTAVSAAAAWVVKAIGDAWGWIKTASVNTWQAVTGAVVTAWEWIKTATSNAWAFVRSSVTAAWDGIRSAVSAGVNAVRTAISSAWDAISSGASSAWSAIRDIVVGAVTGLVERCLSGARRMIDGFGEIWGAIKSAAVKAWDAVSDAIAGAVQGALNRVKGFMNDFRSIGGDIVRGIANGITGTAGAIASAVGDAVSGAVKKAKSLLGISSPSRVFAELGAYTGEGFANGILGQVASVQRAMARMVTAPAPAVAAAGSREGLSSRPATTTPTAGGLGGGPLIVQNIGTYVSGERDDNAVAARLAWLIETA